MVSRAGPFPAFHGNILIFPAFHSHFSNFLQIFIVFRELFGFLRFPQHFKSVFRGLQLFYGKSWVNRKKQTSMYQ